MTRFDALFSLRYAVRVLERQARFWRHMDGSLRVLALLSGSGALAAVWAQQPPAIGMTALAAFAVLQAVEFSLQPGLKAAVAWVARQPYLAALAAQATLTDAELEAKYQAAVTADAVPVFESLRRIAYNDVVEERGCDPTERYLLDRWQRFISTLA